jgi:NDP-sugar pyrophosphorylase family protein
VAITTAVVPVAGLATRLRPLSRGVPKALLPVGGRPAVQHVVDELAACGVERVVLVAGERGRDLRPRTDELAPRHQRSVARPNALDSRADGRITSIERD